MEEKKVPALRFRGFDNAWEQRKLGDSLSFLKDGTHGTHADSIDGPLLLSAKNIKNGSVNWDETDRRISQDEYDKIHSNFNLENGDILLTIVGSIGETAILKDSSGLTFQRSVAFLRPKEEVTSEFLYTEIQIPAFQKELESRKSTSAQPGIYLGDLSEIPVVISKSKDEQRKIGSYFANLDNLIILHQRKLEMLKKVKKSMLEKMFPKNDAKVPELRFSDFTDAWEQRRLGELGHTEGGTSIESEFDSEGKYKVISIGSYSEESDYVDQGIRAIESEKTLRRVLQKNDLTMILNDKTSSGKIIGRVLFIDRSDVFVYNQRTEMIRGYEDRYYPKFLYHLLNAPIQRKKIVKQSQGNTQIYVNWSKVSETQYMIPEVGEQTIISNYFSYFDHLISLHQRKLEKLKNIKKSMLEKMFII